MDMCLSVDQMNYFLELTGLVSEMFGNLMVLHAEVQSTWWEFSGDMWCTYEAPTLS